MIALEDVTEKIGGLHVISGSHTNHVQNCFREMYPWLNGQGQDFASLGAFDKDPSRLVTMKAGDIVLWDSRLIHQGLIGEGYQKGENCPLGPGDLARLSLTVCMAPKSKISNPNVLVKRRELFMKGAGSTTHWPYEHMDHVREPPSHGYDGSEITY